MKAEGEMANVGPGKKKDKHQILYFKPAEKGSSGKRSRKQGLERQRKTDNNVHSIKLKR